MHLKKMDSMGTYRQTKLVNAYPMTRGEYIELRGWGVPTHEDPDTKGMLVVMDEDTDIEQLCWKTIAEFEESHEEV